MNPDEVMLALVNRLCTEVLARYGNEAEDSLFSVSFTDFDAKQTVVLQQLSHAALHHVAHLATEMGLSYLGTKLIVTFDPDGEQQFIIRPLEVPYQR